jgi:hypothetical protein
VPIATHLDRTAEIVRGGMLARAEDLHSAAERLEARRETAYYAPAVRKAAAEIVRPLSDDAAALLADWIEQAGEAWLTHQQPARAYRALAELRALIAEGQTDA